MQLFLAPGDLICDLVGLAPESDHRQILRSFPNTIIWSAVAVTVALALTV